MGAALLAVLATTTPFFALVGAGWWAARRGAVGAAGVSGLNAFVMGFALPAMLLRLGLTLPLDAFLRPALLGVYALAGLPLLLASVWWARRRVGRLDAAFAALVAVFPNSGFMGLPLLAALLGAANSGPVVATIVVDMVLTTSLALALGQSGGARRALMGALRNPLAWSIVAGAALGAAGVVLPAALRAVVDLLAAAASPVALFTIGAMLQRVRHAGPAHAPVWPLSAVKLVVHPLLMSALGWGAVQAGWLTPPQCAALVLVAALPSASNVAMLAHHMGADEGLVPRVILGTTMASFFTFALWAWGIQFVL